MKLRTILTGSTGMVGEGVLLECLDHPEVEQVLVINRNPLGRSQPKLKEIIHRDFFDLAPIESALKGYNTCLFCLGVSSVGLKAGLAMVNAALKGAKPILEVPDIVTLAKN
jgi:uncharacterized protein YbjT (DUF2867 family)